MTTCEMSENDREWYTSRPLVIRELIDKYPMRAKVRIKQTGCPGYINSYCEDGSMYVRVEDPVSGVEYVVFGLYPKDIDLVGGYEQ